MLVILSSVNQDTIPNINCPIDENPKNESNVFVKIGKLENEDNE
jgi:hypothetical protein